MSREISNEQLFEFMTKMYDEMQEEFKEVNLKVDNLGNEVKETKNKVIIIEQEHGKKLDALSVLFCESRGGSVCSPKD